jgi:hypothetical protein
MHSQWPVFYFFFFVVGFQSGQTSPHRFPPLFLSYISFSIGIPIPFTPFCNQNQFFYNLKEKANANIVMTINPFQLTLSLSDFVLLSL